MPASKSPEWVTFEALENWAYPTVRQYTYHYISDERIQQIMADENFAASPLALTGNWWDDSASNASTQNDNPIHPRRVAMLVYLFTQDSREIEPIRIIAEDDIKILCGYCVSDGHHRLRALKFLGRTKFMALLEGQIQPLSQLRLLSGSA